MGKVIVFLLLLGIDIILLIALLVNGCRWGVCCFKYQNCLHRIHVLKKNGAFLLGTFILMVVFICFTQLTVSTPPIKNEDGKIVEGSIAELRKVTLNGHQEWISIRGQVTLVKMEEMHWQQQQRTYFQNWSWQSF